LAWRVVTLGECLCRITLTGESLSWRRVSWLWSWEALRIGETHCWLALEAWIWTGVARLSQRSVNWLRVVGHWLSGVGHLCTLIAVSVSLSLSGSLLAPAVAADADKNTADDTRDNCSQNDYEYFLLVEVTDLLSIDSLEVVGSETSSAFCWAVRAGDAHVWLANDALWWAGRSVLVVVGKA